MPFYLAWIYSNFSRWNFKFFSISDLSYGTNQDFMPFILAQFFVVRYPQKLHSERELETDAEKRKWPKNWLLIKNSYFLSDQVDILVILRTHELSSLTKFHCNRAKIVNFLVMG